MKKTSEGKKIKKIEINLFPESDKKEYEKQRREYIDNYSQYIPGSFLSPGYDKKDPAGGKVKWYLKYPNGFEGWALNNRRLNSLGEQNVINKINEIIDYLNTHH